MQLALAILYILIGALTGGVMAHHELAERRAAAASEWSALDEFSRSMFCAEWRHIERTGVVKPRASRGTCLASSWSTIVPSRAAGSCAPSHDSISRRSSCTGFGSGRFDVGGNEIGCDVTFEIELDGNVIKSITRTSPSTADFIRDVPKRKNMKRCEGPMPYHEAKWLHVHYQEQRKAECAEFDAWSTARSLALKAGKPWSWSLQVGEYPDGDS
jgi:hypothetical protein